MLTLQVCTCESVHKHNQSMRPNATDFFEGHWGLRPIYVFYTDMLMLHTSTSAAGKQFEDLPCLAGRLARGFCQRVFQCVIATFRLTHLGTKRKRVRSARKRSEKPQAPGRKLGLCRTRTRDKMAVQQRYCHVLFSGYLHWLIYRIYLISICASVATTIVLRWPFTAATGACESLSRPLLASFQVPKCAAFCVPKIASPRGTIWENNGTHGKIHDGIWRNDDEPSSAYSICGCVLLL